jgi:Flp pilus assembly protein TadD
VVALGLLGAPGCQLSGPPQRPQLPLAGKPEATPRLTDAQVADVQIAEGRSLEKQGELAQAAAVYREAVKHDPGRADAYLRLGIVHDREGKFKESQEFYQKALKGAPGNAEIYCDVGYSLYLQQRWAEAEMNLRQALALAPDNRRAHNNLGLVLAHEGRYEDAMASFRRAGCTEADAHTNLAYALTLERCWPEARQHYERALAVDSSSTTARRGLKELDTLAAATDANSKKLAAGRPSRAAEDE